MEIIDSSEIFNTEFIKSIDDDKTNYLYKLLEFSSKYGQIDSIIQNNIQEFQNEVVSYVLSHEDIDGYEYGIDEGRKRRIEDILYNIDNYLMSLKPSDAINKFIDGNFKPLIEDANNYFKQVTKDINNKIALIMKNNEIEINNYKIYGRDLRVISQFLENRSKNALLYFTLKTRFFKLEKDTPLEDISKFVDELLIESKIISKFDSLPRDYISFKFDKANKSFKLSDMAVMRDNICEAMLINYCLLSIYSNNPEQLEITENMLNSIMLEVESSTIDESDFNNAIDNGSIKFDEDELEYIHRNFIKKIFDSEDKKSINRYDVLKIIK